MHIVTPQYWSLKLKNMIQASVYRLTASVVGISCRQKEFSLVYTYLIATNYSNGVGSQVLATLVTTLPLHIQINQSM